jgi:hypothetical protein
MWEQVCNAQHVPGGLVEEAESAALMWQQQAATANQQLNSAVEC